MASDGHWMEKAFANSHGQFKAKAKKAGMSTGAFASKEAASPSASTKTKRQANLAKIGAKYGGGHNGHVKTPPPDHPRNPGPYQDDAHKRSYGAAEKDDAKSTGSVGGKRESVEIGPDIQRGREAGTAHTFDRPSARGSHGFGHGVDQMRGALRLSGDRGAHRIGKR